MSAAPPPRSVMPRAVWALGFTSMFMDLSSEAIQALLPIYLTTVLGLSAAALGLIEGVAEATTLAAKIFSGAASDWLGRRKTPALIGYGLAALTKPVFPLASGAALVIAAHVVDRFGKGVRGAPRDALVADLVPDGARGAAFGLRQALDTVGGVFGPLAAIGLMLWSGDDYRFVFWIACIPALLSVTTLALLVPADTPHARTETFPLSIAAMKRLSPAFWLVVALGAGMAMARVSEAFLVLRATGFGLDPAYAPFVPICMSVVYAALAYPAGALADRLGSRVLVTGALATLVAAEAALAAAPSLAFAFVGVALWGLHMACSQGLFSKLVADAAPEALRGTAFGLFNIAGALAIVLGNALFGLLWTGFGPAVSYGAAAGLAALVGAAAYFALAPQRNAAGR